MAIESVSDYVDTLSSTERDSDCGDGGDDLESSGCSVARTEKSLLEVLKAPTPSILARKRKIQSNPPKGNRKWVSPPINKRRSPELSSVHAVSKLTSIAVRKLDRCYVTFVVELSQKFWSLRNFGPRGHKIPKVLFPLWNIWSCVRMSKSRLEPRASLKRKES